MVQLLFDVALNDTDLSLARTAEESLLGFSAAGFSDEMRQKIQAYLERNHKIGRPISMVTLAGVMEVVSAIKILREIAVTPRGSRWAATLALARMGDPAAIQQVVAKAERSVEMHEHHRAMDELVFIRQPDAVAALVRVLFSEDKPHQDGDAFTTKYAQGATERLARIVRGFPVKSLGTSSSLEELEVARQWVMAQSGASNLKIKR